MGIIATGYLQIIVQTEQEKALSHAMIRIYKQVNGEIMYEDYFISDSAGKTPDIPLYVSLDALKEGEPACENYAVEVRKPGYEKKRIENIQVEQNEHCIVLFTLCIDENHCDVREGNPYDICSSKAVQYLPPKQDTVIQTGDHGQAVEILQHYLRIISYFYNDVPTVQADAHFNERTQESLRSFQELLGIPANGTTDALTWRLLKSIYWELTV